MLDLYRIVSLVPEDVATSCSGLVTTTPTATTNMSEKKDGDQGEEEGGAGQTLSTLLSPCTTLLDNYHLGAHLRLASPHSIENQTKLINQVGCLAFLFVGFLIHSPGFVCFHHAELRNLCLTQSVFGCILYCVSIVF